jgi:hypothetical protein
MNGAATASSASGATRSRIPTASAAARPTGSRSGVRERRSSASVIPTARKPSGNSA